MLDHAHFFFDEEGSNLHDIIEHDAEKIFPCDDTKASLFQNQFNKFNLRHLKVFLNCFIVALAVGIGL